MTDSPSPTSGVRRLRWRAHRLRRAILSRRRLLAALFAAAAVAAGLRAAAAPPPATAPVLVARHDLVAGARLTADDVVLRDWPADALPAGHVDRGEVVGRVLAAPLAAGEAVSPVRLAGAGFAATEPGLTALPIRLPDAGVAELLAPGDRIDLIATDPADGTAETLAEDVTVLAVPSAAASSTGLSGDAGGTSGTGGRLVVVAVSNATTTEISAAAVSRYVSVAFSG